MEGEEKLLLYDVNWKERWKSVKVGKEGDGDGYRDLY